MTDDDPVRMAWNLGPSSSRYCAWSRSSARRSVAATVTGRASSCAITDAQLTPAKNEVAAEQAREVSSSKPVSSLTDRDTSPRTASNAEHMGTSRATTDITGGRAGRPSWTERPYDAFRRRLGCHRLSWTPGG